MQPPEEELQSHQGEEHHHTQCQDAEEEQRDEGAGQRLQNERHT